MDAYRATFQPALTAAVIGLLISIVYYMLGKALGGALEQKGKEYLKNAVGNFIVLAALPVLIYLLAELAGALAGHGGFDHYIGARVAILRVESALKSIYFNLFLFHLAFSLLGGFNISFNTDIVGKMKGSGMDVGINIFGGLDIILNKLDDTLTQLIVVYGMLAGRGALLELSPALFIALFPFGILLRSIPWTKKVGSSIIALTMALYLVFPLSVLLSDYILFKSTQHLPVVEFIPSANLLMMDEADPNMELDDLLAETINEASSVDLSQGIVEKTSPLQVAWSIIKSLLTPEALLDTVLVTVGAVLALFPHPAAKSIGLLLAGIGAAPILDWVDTGIQSIVMGAFLFAFSMAYSAAVMAVGIFLSLLLEVVITVSAFRAMGEVLGGETALLGLMRMI